MPLLLAVYLGCLLGIYADLKVDEYRRMNPPPMSQQEIDARDAHIDIIIESIRSDH